MDLHLLLDLAVEAFPDRVVLQEGERRLTAPDLRVRALIAADDLVSGGHDSLMYIGPWGVDYATAVFAASLAGVPLIPLNFRLGSDQLAGLAGNHPGALLVAETLDTIPEAQRPNTCVQLGAWSARLATGAQPPADRPSPGTDGSGPAVLLYTSGTTAAPKAAILRHANLTTYVMTTVELASASEQEASLVTTPPYHVAGLANLLSNLFSGRRMVSVPVADGRSWLTAAAEGSVTHAFVVPTLLKRIVDAQLADPIPLPSLGSIAYGGSRTPPQVVLEAMEAFPGVAFTQAYGLTETSSTISVLGPDDHRAAATGDTGGIVRLGSVGRPLPGVDVEIRQPSGAAAPTGQPGRVWLRGDQVSGEYANGAPALDDAGWFDTRDRGYLDDGGYLFILGRDDDTIIRGAENIAPAEIEDVLLEHPGVRDVVVVGLPDAEWGQVPAAAVVCEDDVDIDLEELQEWSRARLRSSKTPVLIVRWDELPMTDNGKVLRRVALTQLMEPPRS